MNTRIGFLARVSFVGLALVTVAAVVGCGDVDVSTSDQIGCDGAVQDGLTSSDQNEGGGGAKSAEGGGGMAEGATGRPDGASCSVGSDCNSDYCVPSKNSFGTGYCFSLEMLGCIVVTDPSPKKALCNSPFKRLFTCGSSWDTTTLGTCTNIGSGDIGENYFCCDKPSPL